MTQLEIDLVNGLPTLTPTKDSEYGYTLALSPAVVVPNKNAKCDVVSASLSSNEKSGFFISFSISREEGEKFNVMENLMTRGTELNDGDERMAEYRRHLATAMKLAVANGLARLPDGYTMADLEKAKGVRWAWKAGCSCGCSPAFSTPLWAKGEGRFIRSTRRNGRGRWARYQDYNWMNVSLKLKADESVTMAVRCQPEQIAAAIEVRPVNKEVLAEQNYGFIQK
jgi:hypothetical protein